MSGACCPMPPQHENSQTQAMESCCELHPPSRCGPAQCPACGALGKPVARITLGTLLKPERRPQIPPRQEEFCFCRTPTCDVVYFLPGKPLFRQGDLSVAVGLKEPANLTAPVCYCFGWTPQKIRAEIEATGQSTAIDQIKAQVKAGNCYCEVTNPQGSCCLGNVAKAVQEATALVTGKRGETR